MFSKNSYSLQPYSKTSYTDAVIRVMITAVGTIIGSTQLKFNLTKIIIAVVKSIEASSSRTLTFTDRIVTSTVNTITTSVSRVLTFADRVVTSIVKAVVSQATSYVWYDPWLTGIVNKFDSLKGRRNR